MERPKQDELKAFATLVRDRPSEPDPSIASSSKDLLEKLDYHGITLLAAENNRLPPELNSEIAQRKAMMVANNVLKQKALIELFDAFFNAGLENCVLFKGSALAHTLYSKSWLRPRSDSDCLINLIDYDAFSQVFESLGYQKLFAIEGKYVSYQTTFSKALAGKSVMDIDLHWRINNRQSLSGAYSVEELKRDGTTLAALSPSISIPSHVDSLLIASLHRLGHHASEERLTWLYDIHLLARSLNTDQWTELVAKARAKQLSAITLNALTSCESILGTQVPPEIKESLADVDDEVSAIFLQRDIPEWRYFLHDLKSMPSLSAKLGLLRENVFPAPDYVRQQMGTTSVLLAYLKRFLRGAKRVLRV